MLVRLWLLLPVMLLGLRASTAPSAAGGAELEPETVAAYERYIEQLEREFSARTRNSHRWLEHLSDRARAELRRGEILVGSGKEDGILKVPDGLIHHWRGAAFLPDATLESVLAVAQDYASYARTYSWVIRSSALRHVRELEPRRDLFWIQLRIERRASMVTSTVDLWGTVEYLYPQPGGAVAMSNSDCVRQVEDAGESDERLLPIGQGSGYLWRANTYSRYLQQDGGVYIDLQTLGLSRGFPPLLGWIIEPIARRLGRGSAGESLKQLREAVGRARGSDPGTRQKSTTTTESAPPTGWCGGDGQQKQEPGRALDTIGSL